MTRDILFRGKRLDTEEWVEGDFLTHANAIISEIDDDGLNLRIREGFDVDPSTVGQFTGLTDKNGKRIFEGDVVLTDEAGWVATVIYDAGAFLCVDNHGGFSAFCNWDAFEVIGNIHDNPELLSDA